MLAPRLGPRRTVVLLGLLAVVADAGWEWALRQVPRSLVFGWVALVVAAIVATAAAPLPVESLIGDSGRRAGALSVLLLFAAFPLGVAVRDRLGQLLRPGPGSGRTSRVPQRVRRPCSGRARTRVRRWPDH